MTRAAACACRRRKRDFPLFFWNIYGWMPSNRMVKHASLIFMVLGIGGGLSCAAAPAALSEVPPGLPAGPVRGSVPIVVLEATNKLFLSGVSGIFTNFSGLKTCPPLKAVQTRVYKAVPYSMIVVIPGPMLDDSMVKPAPPVNRMPIKRPPLELIPLGKRD